MTNNVAVVTRNHQLVALLRCYLPPDEKLEVFSRVETLGKVVQKAPPNFLLVDYHFPGLTDDSPALFSVPVYFVTIHSEDKKNCNPSSILFCIPEDVPYLCSSIADSERLKMVSSVLAGTSPAIKKVRKSLVEAMNSDLPVLLTGPSGTGKTLCARLIHDGSDRKTSPFFPVNMLSVPEALIESELFGVSTGAYTDAKEREGYFAAAKDGTIFLDEIGDIPKPVQGKLLYTVENRLYRSVGSDTEKLCRARLVFATNVNLLLKVKKGQFREDLFYRLKSQVVYLPPLSERREDISALCALFLKDTGKHLSPSAQALVETLEWRGNVRELKNCLMNAASSSQGDVIDALDIKQF